MKKDKIVASKKAIDLVVSACVGRNRFTEAVKIASLGSSDDILDELFDICLKEGHLPSVIKLTELCKRVLTQDELNDLLNICIENGYLCNAVMVANYLKKDLTENELANLLEAYIKKLWLGNKEEIARRIIDFGVTEDRLIILINACAKEIAKPNSKIRDLIKSVRFTGDEFPRFKDAVEKAILLDDSRMIFERSLSSYIRDHQVYRAVNNAESLTKDGIDDLMDRCIKEGWLKCASEIIYLEADQNRLDALIDLYMQQEDNSWLKYATEAANRGASEEKLYSLFDACIDQLRSSYARELIGKVISFGANKERLSNLVDLCVRKDELKQAIIVAEYIV